MTLRTNISGTFDSAALERLTWPVAWSGTVSEADRREQEADLHDLINEAREALANDGAFVEIEAGTVVAVIVDAGVE